MFDNEFYLNQYLPETPDICYINVQPLPRNMPDSQAIVFGADFFNSFLMLREMGSGINATDSFTLALSGNGVAGGAIINVYFYTEGPTPFVVQPTVFDMSL